MTATVASTSMQENRIVRLPEVMRLTGLSKATIHRRYRDGTFPRPLRLGPQSIGWWRTEILEWLGSLQRAGAKLEDGGERKTQVWVTGPEPDSRAFLARELGI